MKNKKLIYILVPATIFIWGAIGYTVFSNLKKKNVAQDQIVLPDMNAATDTIQTGYSLLPTYRDPFNYRVVATKKAEKKQEDNTRNIRTRARSNYNRQPRITWPEIYYHGVIDNQNDRVALITVDSKKYIIEQNEWVQQIKVLSLYPDSIVLEYQEEKKSFIKN